MASFFGRDPFINGSAVNSVVGTWQGAGTTVVNGTRQSETGVIQFFSNGTFQEGIDVAGNLAAYIGTYSFSPSTDRITYTVTSASPSTGPQPNPAVGQTGLSSSVVTAGSNTGVKLNNNLFFLYKSASVASSDFTLPAASATGNIFGNNFNLNLGATNQFSSNNTQFNLFPHF